MRRRGRIYHLTRAIWLRACVVRRNWLSVKRNSPPARATLIGSQLTEASSAILLILSPPIHCLLLTNYCFWSNLFRTKIQTSVSYFLCTYCIFAEGWVDCLFSQKHVKRRLWPRTVFIVSGTKFNLYFK